MAKLPRYLEVEVSYKPTELDQTGCDGIYLKSYRIKWWARIWFYPVWFLQAVWRNRN